MFSRFPFLGAFMKKLEFFHVCMVVLCVSGVLGFSFGYGKWFDSWVFLPSFPNALDSAFLAFSSFYLGGLCFFFLKGGRM